MSFVSHILFIAPYVPSHIRVRPYHLLRGLAGRGHRITLVCPVQSATDAYELEALKPLCTRVVGVPQSRPMVLANYLRALPGRLPLQAAHNLSPAMVAAVRDELRRADFDIVHVEHLRGAEVALAATTGLADLPPLLLDAVDSISLLFERTLRHSPALSARMMALADLARTRRYEAAYLERFDHVLVTSPEDGWALETLRQRYGRTTHSPVTVLPNGVDLDYFAPDDSSRERATLIFSGKMSYHANHAAALFLLRQVMPQVWRKRRDVQVMVVGAKPGASLQALAADGRVTVTGYVPDLRPYLARATMAICPIRYGVGIQNKVLEAMAMGTPVIASHQTTVALAARPGDDLLIAGTEAEFADQILELLDAPQRQEALGQSGRHYVEQNHSWQASIVALEASYNTARLTRSV